MKHLTLALFLFFPVLCYGQKGFAPKGYILSVEFPGSYEVSEITEKSILDVFKQPYHAAVYSSDDNKLTLTGIFGTYRQDKSPKTQLIRMSMVKEMARSMKKEVAGKFFFEEYFEIGPAGSGASFTLSKGKGTVPVLNVMLMVIENKLYLFSGRLRDLKYQQEVLKFMQSATNNLFTK
jgi:hypothetical protein